jgi:lipoate-protein ligase A
MRTTGRPEGERRSARHEGAPVSAPRMFRVIDTGLRSGRAQIAFDQAMIDAHKAGEIPDSIRFLRFPPTALIGRHQALSHEVRVDYCKTRGVGTARRVTGGGAIYFDEGQLGWSLVFDRGTLSIASLADLAREICEAAAAGLRRLGVDARYRPRNDIEVAGRKISGTGGFFDGDTLFYQGTVLIDLDPARMLAALNVPEAKLAKRALDSAAQRVVTLKELLGSVPDLATVKSALLEGFAERLDIAPVEGEISAREEALAAVHFDEEIGTEAFVASIDDPGASADVRAASHSGAGGTITAYLRLEGPRGTRLREVLITGDFFVTPPRVVYDLESALRGVEAADARATVERFFQQAQVGLLSVAPGDFASAIESAVAAAVPTEPR